MNANPPPMPPGQSMSQSEVERLLASVGDLDPAAGGPVPQSPGSSHEHGSLTRHVFPPVSSFSAGQLRTLRVRHEEYIRALASRFSGHLRLECGLQMSKLETVRFQQYVEGLSNPTHLVLFRLEPLKGICLLDIPPHLALGLVDRELGGPGVFQDDPRELTKMETRLVSRVVDIITGEWCANWGDLLEFRPLLLRHETSGRFLQTHAPDQLLLVLGMEVRIGDLVEQMQMAFPYSILEPLLLKANSDIETVKKAAAAQPAARPRWDSALDDVEIQVRAEWPGAELTVSQLGGLKCGDIIPIGPGAADGIRLSLGATPKFLGHLGVSGRRWAVKITGTLKS
jgi:flagellar motor switch protein FliM